MDTTQYEKKFRAAIEHFTEEMKKIRTGRAHPDMLDGISVEVYGAKMPLNQIASISAPESQQILITPFDPANIGAISSAISNNQSLGLNPSDDGRNVRVPIPALNEERRREIVKVLNEKVEDSRIALRNIREDARKSIKILTEISDDEKRRLEKGIDDFVVKANAELDDLAKDKEKEIMKV